MNKFYRQALLLCGLGNGDECKGSVTDHLARVNKAHTVVRYGGASQAAHNVVLSDGRHHTFAQFGSASFIRETRTFLSRFMLINPLRMLVESDVLESKGVRGILSRTSVDDKALIITPFHTALNQIRELARGDERHGSCGQGVGETVKDAELRPDLAIRVGDLRDMVSLEDKLYAVRDYKKAQVESLLSNIRNHECLQLQLSVLDFPRETAGKMLRAYEEFAQSVAIVGSGHLRHILAREGTVIFEGAQGVLLDQSHGFSPHVTSTTTTLENAETLMRECSYGPSLTYEAHITRYGLLRTYATRHGYGPFVSEDAEMGRSVTDVHNSTHDWQGEFRVGHFDLVASRYALSVAGAVECLAISCVDRLQELPSWDVCVAYEHPRFGVIEKLPTGYKSNPERLTKLVSECRPILERFKHRDVGEYLRFIESSLGIPVRLTSHGPTEKDKRMVGH